ncbi:S9 family peptidase [Myroides odoratus]|uniref:Prolyl tripeptidyl peptidase n=1 Tax=Myroides odoratus TaxID=256 RepID=A0A378U240_MYROD|nr:S9 family peptidase [Myroides odoratus]MCS4239951.1 dipeptidyl aminopeptidase/acylaminoacyl peptidase [Myroides odoratus]MDH6602553.1 dipeptidyl aminopeptidase/acylaminoacyl peptidase [Myroides gitamensis]QQU03676.1 S9 family peptidase [Myroides odoratus]STZ69051.1 Prolyl tripeptidyl peptidase precursor [Myroides odoratus]
MKKIVLFALSLACFNVFAQDVMTKELLWKLGRVSPVGISKDGKNLIYKVTHANVEENSFDSKTYQIPLTGGKPVAIESYKDLVSDATISPDGKHIVFDETVKINNVLGKDLYPTMQKADAYVFDGLDYRHWDTWNDGTHNHVFYAAKDNKDNKIDIMQGEPYDAPQKPFGGGEDYVWAPDGKSIVYVSKKKFGTDYALSTNTDLYQYDLATKQTKNLTASNVGYDTHPTYSPQGHLTWLQMKRDGYEADKNDIIVRMGDVEQNLTANWDGTVDSYQWSKDGSKVYFVAAVGGTVQLFEVNFPGLKRIAPVVRQLTDGNFDVTGIVGLDGDKVVLTRTDFNHATEIFSYDLKKKSWNQITKVNDEIYSKIALSKSEKRIVKTVDGKDMVTWVVYPPNFDPNKKYPTLLYAQGGPQSALSQFYSFRWNFQLMAAEGYIIVAPNRRGMPGHGVEWNEAISKDWGGKPMQDYLAAIDDVAKENYVDKARLGAIGASYGGYSVFYLAGIHENRFKTFISHCGVFDLVSMYGTTEEVFFPNFDTGGAYWEKDNKDAQNAIQNFNPINNVDKWNTPILIIQGGKDYRVPIGQGQEAFQAAQLRGIKSRFLYLPEENHWVVQPQNAQVWQGEFFRWLKETL